MSFDSEQYWINRYAQGHSSGAGSYREYAVFKSDVINRFVELHNIPTIIEFGSGDGNMLTYYKFDKYLGLDVSPGVISKCREMFKANLNYRFALLKEYQQEKADLTMSIDVLYHLIEQPIYEDHIQQLFTNSNKYVIIYSSCFDSNEGNAHVLHRNFLPDVERLHPDFSLVKTIHPPSALSGTSASFYIFSKEKQ